MSLLDYPIRIRLITIDSLLDLDSAINCTGLIASAGICIHSTFFSSWSESPFGYVKSSNKWIS
jgi:hypothetical protein